MIDFVIDHMENAGVVFASRNELARSEEHTSELQSQR